MPTREEIVAHTPVGDTTSLTNFLRALGDETRLKTVQLLLDSDLKAGEIALRLGAPQNAVSYHLKVLRTTGLLRDRHSSLDGRDVYYSLDGGRLEALYQAVGAALAAGGESLTGVAVPAPTGRPWRVLFLCTHNSARSQLAEAILRRNGGAAVSVSSGGNEPGEVHPLTIRLLREWGIDPRRHYSKPTEAVSHEPFDDVITVCDRMREGCPTFQGDPHRIHWSIPDPVAVPGPEAQWPAFRSTGDELTTRIKHLLRQRVTAPPQGVPSL